MRSCLSNRFRWNRSLALACAVLAGLPGATGAASAEPIAAVIEMFTSQGCATCRAAEPVMRDLARRPGIIALTLPVTYWDYLGWPDTLALRRLNDRQRGYAGRRGRRQVFTPQAVVDGGPSTLGSDRSKVEHLLREAARAGGLPLPVQAEANGGRIVVEIGAPSASLRDERGDVWLVPVLRSRITPIATGENAGRTASDVNVVRGLVRIGSWSGESARYEVPSAAATGASADGWVVLVQRVRDGHPGRILGAAKGPGL